MTEVPAINILKHALEDLGSASENARLQLHLLALEARERTGAIETGIGALEHRLDQGIHQALSNATHTARQLAQTVKESWRGHPPMVGPHAERLGTLMSSPARSCSPRDSLAQVAQILWDHDCGAVPVVDADGRPCGMVTDRDVCMGAYTKGKALHEILVSDVMSRHLHSCSLDEPLERAIAIMIDAQVRRVPIVDHEGRLAGILSLADVVRAVVLLGQREAETLVFDLLAAVSRRRSGEQLAAQ
ncbi:MAG TPA: CBS domain-containing protein [Polyangiaceae bacterium]|nr:CBS domain-containing protein [Polyangiaceae bacterium]